MKFQPDLAPGVNLIQRFDGHQVWVAGQAHAGPVLVPWQGGVQPWALAAPEALEATHFDDVLALAPELVIYGSGPRQRFPAPRALAALMARRIGVETMDSAAACRTYNVLAGEGRQVVVALWLGASA